MARSSASALVARADTVASVEMPACRQVWPTSAQSKQGAIGHANVRAIDAGFGGEGNASAQLATGAYLLPATAADGTSKFRLRRLRIPPP